MPARQPAGELTRTPAPDLDTAHDPGPDGAAERLAALPEDVASVPIKTAGGGSVRLGTASWTDPTMTARGVFYPTDADTAEERLAYYASRFPIVEVDATYYALPARRTAELWVERTPPDFTFDIKAHALMTGQPTEVKRLPKDLREALPIELAEKSRIYAKDLPDDIRDEVWARFADALEPLAEAGQLGSILLQYPRWFFTSSENRDTIEEATGRLKDAGMIGAVEFRSASWFNEKNLERTLRFLGDREIPLVVVDGPQGFKSSVPAITDVPSKTLVDRPVPRPSDRHVGGDRDPDRRTVPLPLRRQGARRVGAEDRAHRRAGRGGPRAVQQLLCELRLHERPADGEPPGRSARLVGYVLTGI